MELNEKLQELRKRKGITQEELAQNLFISRTAVSKWESGRGVPNIESLKAIANFFDISLDELLSNEELLTIAEADQKEKHSIFCDLVFGIADICMIMMFFLPLFARNILKLVVAVPLLETTQPYLKITYSSVVIAMALFGLLTLSLQSCKQNSWIKIKRVISLILSLSAVFLFIICRQPYAATFVFLFLIIKVMVLIKHR